MAGNLMRIQPEGRTIREFSNFLADFHGEIQFKGE